MNLLETLEIYKKDTIDICEHLDTLKDLSKECDHVTEMGFRFGASFCALLLGHPKKLITYDLQIPKAAIEYFDKLKGDTEIVFHEADTLKISIENTDMLFIDTLHTYEQLKKELKLHGWKAKKYLVFHDTVSFGRKGEDGSKKGLMDAIEEYIKERPEWVIKDHYENNNGLMVLERK